jgi:VRR-NUC domain
MNSIPPLIMLCEGRKPRPRKASKSAPKEIVLHMAVAKLLREHCLLEWQWFHPRSGELRDLKTAAKLKRMGLKAGLPDIALIGPTGIFHALELKRLGETLSDAQEAFQLWCIRHGVPHSVAYSFDEALLALNTWGCLRIRIGGSR